MTEHHRPVDTKGIVEAAATADLPPPPDPEMVALRMQGAQVVLEPDSAARADAADAERAEIEQLYEAAKKAKAERDEEADRAFAELLAARREAEKDTDPSLGPQMTLDKRGLFAKAARGGIAGTMAGNLDALSIATAEEAQP